VAPVLEPEVVVTLEVAEVVMSVSSRRVLFGVAFSVLSIGVLCAAIGTYVWRMCMRTMDTFPVPYDPPSSSPSSPSEAYGELPTGDVPGKR
jgi:hypothetical protein